jgi:hypothetical protein
MSALLPVGLSGCALDTSDLDRFGFPLGPQGQEDPDPEQGGGCAGLDRVTLGVTVPNLPENQQSESGLTCPAGFPVILGEGERASHVVIPQGGKVRLNLDTFGIVPAGIALSSPVIPGGFTFVSGTSFTLPGDLGVAELPPTRDGFFPIVFRLDVSAGSACSQLEVVVHVVRKSTDPRSFFFAEMLAPDRPPGTVVTYPLRRIGTLQATLDGEGRPGFTYIVKRWHAGSRVRVIGVSLPLSVQNASGKDVTITRWRVTKTSFCQGDPRELDGVELGATFSDLSQDVSLAGRWDFVADVRTGTLLATSDFGLGLALVAR